MHNYNPFYSFSYNAIKLVQQHLNIGQYPQTRIKTTYVSMNDSEIE